MLRFGAPAWVFGWDCVSSWYRKNRPLQRMKLCFWYGDVREYIYDGAHYGEPCGKRRVVWNSRGQYVYEPDPRGKHLSDLFQQSISKLHSSVGHSHTKPLDWMRLLIGCCTAGDVFDPFIGSGTTLLACEQLGRRCVGIEIDPRSVDVAVSRWEQMTGREAVVANG